MQNSVFVDSEIGKLEKVIIHTPGIEIESMTPKTAKSLLYNDVIPLSVIRNEHLEFRRLLSMFCKTYEVNDLLKVILEIKEVRIKLIKYICTLYDIKFRQDDLLSLSVEDVLMFLVSGLKSKKNTLESFLNGDDFDLPPIPNLYFTRDSSVVLENSVLISAMANKVRKIESLLFKFIFMYHPEFKRTNIFFDGTEINNSEITIEGGDFIVLNKNTFVVGVSQRTSTKAIDLISSKFNKPVTIFCVLLPDERAFIHLDMIFTIIAPDRALVYEPCLFGSSSLPVLKILVNPGKDKKIERIDNLFLGLKEQGINLKAVFCGGKDPVKQQRNQWLSGNNFLSFAPGKIIGYDCNDETLEALNEDGFSIQSSVKINKNNLHEILSIDKLAITIPGSELARGGGGPRCMTMPVKRESFKMGK